MKKLFIPILTAVLITGSAFTFITAQRWEIQDGYEIKFSSEDPNGVFTALSGDIDFNPKDLENSMFNVSVDVNSINTGNGMQNKHALSDDWFDAKTYPKIKFASKNIEKTDKGYIAHGKMKMHGVEKDFDMPFKYEGDSNKGVFTSKFKINRNDFNIGGPGKKASDVMDMELKVAVKR